MFTGVKLWWHSKRLSSKRCKTRENAARALGELGDPRAVNLLIEAMADSRSGVSAVMEALGKLRDPRAVEPLIKALGNSSAFLRQATANALGELGDARAVEPLIKALGDGDSHARKNAAEALSRLGEVKWKPLIRVRRKKHGLPCFVEQTWHEWMPKIGGERESGRFRESGTT